MVATKSPPTRRIPPRTNSAGSSDAARRRTISRSLALLALAYACLWVIVPMRSADNPAHESARTFTARMQATSERIWQGEAAPGDFTRGDLGFTVTEVEVQDRTVLMLVGEHEGRCYVMRWRPGFLPHAGVLTEGAECAPSAVLDTPGVYERESSASASDVPGVMGTSIDWDQILPTRTLMPPWYPAALSISVVVLVAAAAWLVVALLPRSRVRDRDHSGH